MAVVARTTKLGVVFWVMNRQSGKRVWERVGTNRRDAERRDASMKKEIADGSYFRRMTGAVTVASFAHGWLAKRQGRSAETETNQFTFHVLGRCAWYGKLKVEDARPRHTLQLLEQLRLPYTGRYGENQVASEKTIALLMGTLKTMFRDARIAELTPYDPVLIPRGSLSRKSKKKRIPYEAAEAAMLVSDPRVDWDDRIWNMLAFFTGMREGEVCGRRWRDIDRGAEPLWSMMVHTQYNDQALKGDSREKDRPRNVPIHPELERALNAWWRDGFELVHCRKPKIDDFIVPRRDANDENLTRAMAYKRFIASCKRVGVEPHTVHSTRYTFISLCRRAGARTELVEKITHNAAGTIVDQYTDWAWRPLCEAVLCFPVVPSPSSPPTRHPARTPATEGVER